MNRCPTLTSPLTRPAMVTGTTAPSNTHRMPRSGRTQRSVPSPQIIDFGQGNDRTIGSTISARISRVARPAFDRVAK